MLDDLLDKVMEYNKKADIELIDKAYSYAMEKHAMQKRFSGEPYIVHPTAVAEILADLQMDTPTICAGLLHDVIEDTEVTYEKIKNDFGKEIADLVDGVTKLGKIDSGSKVDDQDRKDNKDSSSKVEEQAENMRKMLLAMSKDIRVILIKLADRLHNMRTLKYIPPDKQREKAQETLEIYAPIAHRLGISKIQWELEDLSLRYLDPEGYYDLVEKIAKKRAQREEYIKNIIAELKAKLDEIGIKATIDGRPKHFYSIYKKMKEQDKNFEQIFDLTAIRVIVDTVKDCYGVLGIVHTMWKPIPGRFKDYIAMPKPNMYQSLHTTLIGPGGETFEVQIRTWEMHRTAEYGIAAHWKYKEGKKNEDQFDEKLSWLRQLLEWQGELKDAREFMETLKIDLFTDEVYVFTPKGDVINLPIGSTPIDFAYTIHTDIGHRCVGAKVNGKLVPLDYKLNNGDIVSIITSTNTERGPSRDWLSVVKSSQAKNKIKQWFKKERREENIARGKEILEHELNRLRRPKYISTDEILEEAAKRIGIKSVEDLYAALGYGGLATSQVMPRIREIYRERKELTKDIVEEARPETKSKKERREKTENGIRVPGVDNVLIRIAKCCSPVPGDEIIGYITKGRGVSVHRVDCPNVNGVNVDKSKLIAVDWGSKVSEGYQADIQVYAVDRYGLPSEITGVLSDNKVPVKAVNAKTGRDNRAVINMTVEINTKDELEKIMNRLKGLNGVRDVFRINAV
ncbi:MAG: bifunctional (p)ppGpp synthetase/guanosine-3',5'-bis(diphosphate) 3'-pyrophosphohydrolase [Thermoanaerobacteraceae bacterium]|nr:bifunctional (p)ppGpp synthetase/guanosine-3',5'-bis(diphosphate) 3'-pyrophosphohydrolase [Thermoanaerobacteraceae bacterium]